MTYDIQDAIDMLDSIASGITPTRPVVVHGAVTLALHIKANDADLVAMLHELELFIAGKVERVSQLAVDRAGPIASKLRHGQGLH